MSNRQLQVQTAGVSSSFSDSAADQSSESEPARIKETNKQGLYDTQEREPADTSDERAAGCGV